MPWLTIGTPRSLIVCSGTSVTPCKSAFIPKLLSGLSDHATMKFMSARSSSLSPNDLAGASVETVHEIVQRAAGKLSVLQARRTHIRKRIQALLHLSRALSEDAAISRSSRSEKVTIAIGSSRSTPLEGNVRLDRTSASAGLRRACRIALIETDDAECELEKETQSRLKILLIRWQPLSLNSIGWQMSVKRVAIRKARSNAGN